MKDRHGVLLRGLSVAPIAALTMPLGLTRNIDSGSDDELRWFCVCVCVCVLGIGFGVYVVAAIYTNHGSHRHSRTLVGDHQRALRRYQRLFVWLLPA